ncbi:MAG: hypothetical protein LBP89_08690 [Helicobacteraceae bacterium]|jgi:hypothetical protein|nr:hypothetical protein [Helicobacteraceae bacterium]
MNSNEKPTWYRPKYSSHFDYPLSEENAINLLKQFETETKHAFFPLILTNKKTRRYRTERNETTHKKINLRKEPKIRSILEPSHKDGYIYSYYAEKLNKIYEERLKKMSSSDAVCAYRSNRGYNYTVALEVFAKVKSLSSCSCFMFDIENFFGSIDHASLKFQLCELLNTQRLPADYFKVFNSITRYAYINGDHIPSNDINGDRRICSHEQFIKLREEGKIEINENSWGIPQGVQISPTLANIYMTTIDQKLNKLANENNGIYRRYADDIAIITPDLSIKKETIEATISNMLAKIGARLN